MIGGAILLLGAVGAEPAVRLTVDDLLRLARPTAGECYAVPVPKDRIPDGPPRLFVYAAEAAGDTISIRLRVPADGWYRVRSRALLGPWGPTRHGRFTMTAGGVEMPGCYQGWYGPQRDRPYRMTDIDWGVVHLSAPAVELRIGLSHGAHGRLLLLADLRLESVQPDKLGEAERARRAASAPPIAAARVATKEPWPLCETTFQRDLAWTTAVRRAGRPIHVDAKLDDWPAAPDWPIRIDAKIPPGHGWAAPRPAGDADLSARVALAWDETCLYLAAAVRDDERAPKTDQQAWDSPWSHDGLVVQVTPPGWLTGGRRSTGLSPSSVSFGLNYCVPGAAPRPLPAGSRYAVQDTADGYVIEAALAFRALGWTPAQAGDRFPLALILVDRDARKPAGDQFHQYGWNYGPGSMAGMGEVRLRGTFDAAGELIAEHRNLAAGQPIRYIGTIDAWRPVRLKAIEVLEADSGRVAASYAVTAPADRPGRYRVMGELPGRSLKPGRYTLELRWTEEAP